MSLQSESLPYQEDVAAAPHRLARNHAAGSLGRFPGPSVRLSAGTMFTQHNAVSYLTADEMLPGCLDAAATGAGVRRLFI